MKKLLLIIFVSFSLNGNSQVTQNTLSSVLEKYERRNQKIEQDMILSLIDEILEDDFKRIEKLNSFLAYKIFYEDYSPIFKKHELVILSKYRAETLEFKFDFNIALSKDSLNVYNSFFKKYLNTDKVNTPEFAEIFKIKTNRDNEIKDSVILKSKRFIGEDVESYEESIEAVNSKLNDFFEENKIEILDLQFQIMETDFPSNIITSLLIIYKEL